MLKSLFCSLALFSVIYANNVHAAKVKECQTEVCVSYFNQYKAAAKRGHGEAMHFLGELYYAGYGTQQNIELALYYFKKAAKGGVVAGHYKAGLVYLSHPNFKNVDKGIRYLETAARKNFKNANFLLAIIYINKQFGLLNLQKADAYLAKIYLDRHPDVPTLIEYIEEEKSINESSFPRLYQVMSQQPLQKSAQGKLAWPIDQVEVITITSPKVEEVLSERLVLFRRPTKALGSRLPNNACNNRFGCYSAFGFDSLRDFPFLTIN
ncbi:sel1 repeat family protein [Thalassotalea sp. M1531]|uniref:Sel1 repeat family protein n=1 Tax=Thalassotalea algicola TaxID=2716224 RepID=A0A7Y0LD18_9GAMM|nr:tetratricopeptide repeat protein [Thalassotalea algicola]NMP32201.1 sel1 repeat family protein [Thalassotalea algicola]